MCVGKVSLVVDTWGCKRKAESAERSKADPKFKNAAADMIVV